MKVIITEKPSVARDIAKVLKISDKKNGFIAGKECAITWAFGHLVTLLEPGEYDLALKRWSLDTLPFVPSEFKLKLIENRGVQEQFSVIKSLCEEADEIVCATDAGREGELIFRYILALAGCEHKPIRRLWLSSLTPDAIQSAFQNLKEGHAYDSLYAAARCRSEADWIVGLNATRCHTVRHGRVGGGDRVLWSVGRVQTPVLAMIVERDDQIDQFRPQPFWELSTRYREVVFKHVGDRFFAWSDAEPKLNEVEGQPFKVVSVCGKKKTEQPPQLFDLTTLQREVNKSHGLSAAETLAAAQNLYEAKLLTYPRTDSRYLTADMKPRIPNIFQGLSALYGEQISSLDFAALPFTKRLVDDKKVSDHHALIPTGIAPGNLGRNEQIVFGAVALQFIAAFYPVCIKRITTVEGRSAGVKFQAKGTQVLQPGWSVLFSKKRAKAESDEQVLPAFEAEECGEHEPFLREGKTKPPKAFTENSLLGAMEAAGKWVDDDATREALKERGIGTPATRAAIIETLLRRSYVRRQKKQIRATDMGRCLIALIGDPLLKSPGMTGEWEEKLKKIERNELDDRAFMDGIGDYISRVIGAARGRQLDVDRMGACPHCGREVIRGRAAYGCSGWKRGCDFVLNPNFKGLALSKNQIQVLLQMRVLPYPVQIDRQPRLLILSTQGDLMDIGIPSASNQRSETEGSRAESES